ncbi:MAG: GDP-mannose 4,6-dehydratase [Candidatus Omnitrophica bacterium]|nr:GDP-mannose 4,6-dehydratase [Candidatus Omnitrophota bacterium]
MKTAIIIGCEGQDGRIAFDALLSKDYRVLGLGIGLVKDSGIGWNQEVDVTDKDQVAQLVKSVRADEVYYLAACHQSSEDRLKDHVVLFQESYAVNVLGLLNFLEGIKRHASATRLFYAGSSLIYAGTTTLVQDESTPFCPTCIYGITKLDGLLLCRYYRSQHGIFASTGILYNHESPYRQENFISTKIIKAAINIKQGQQEVLTLGDLNAEVDWGYAPDYVEAMHRILNIDHADEFIIASGKKHSVCDFVQIVFDCLDMDWQPHVRQDASLVTRKRKTLVGNPQKLIDLTGWHPTVDFSGMIKLLLEEKGVLL